MEYRFQQFKRKVFDLRWEELKQSVDIVPYEDIKVGESYILVQKITYKAIPGRRPAGVIKQRESIYRDFILTTSILGNCKVFDVKRPLDWRGYSTLYEKDWFVYKE